MKKRKPQGRAKGGVARAKALSAEERAGIAKKAAEARWNEALPVAVCGSPDRPLNIGGIELPCYVLEDGTRILSQAGFLEALGKHRRAGGLKERDSDGLSHPFLRGKAVRPFVTPALLEKSRPILFRTPTGVRASGYRADLLPDICEIYLKARDSGDLPSNQRHIAKQAEVLVRGLAHVGIIALVDEATGYQTLRSKAALAEILEAFIAKELQPWLATFPDDFYREMFRLRGLEYPKDRVKRPQYFGHLTNDVVYKRLAPGVLDELKRVTPRSETGRAKHRYFQRLTTNAGYPKLREHLGSVVTLMKLSDEWHDFSEKLDRFHPRFGDTLQLPFELESDDGRGL